MSKKAEFVDLLTKYKETFGADYDYSHLASWDFAEEDLGALINDLKDCLKSNIPAFGTLLPDIPPSDA